MKQVDTKTIVSSRKSKHSPSGSTDESGTSSTLKFSKMLRQMSTRLLENSSFLLCQKVNFSLPRRSQWNGNQWKDRSMKEWKDPMKIGLNVNRMVLKI
ncbi:hypothetical protein NPIL_204681 [Nephila pilipes]|uniref:Uncharacterized protein n=1 Tax=Nephila pilipes TaxID=299642 RepID=A0A8X6I882_NEPPI|nr:hypothetical protein NPIL_204681 [Nephila pilipes]